MMNSGAPKSVRIQPIKPHLIKILVNTPKSNLVINQNFRVFFVVGWFIHSHECSEHSCKQSRDTTIGLACPPAWPANWNPAPETQTIYKPIIYIYIYIAKERKSYINRFSDQSGFFCFLQYFCQI